MPRAQNVCHTIANVLQEFLKHNVRVCMLYILVTNRPAGCNTDLYTVITQCHNIKPEHRPTFSEILMLLPSQDNIGPSLDMDTYESTDHM